MKRAYRALVAQPFEWAVGILSLVQALTLLVHPASGFILIPAAVAVLWQIIMVVAGPLVLFGMLWTGGALMALAIERAGLILLATAWGARALILIVTAPAWSTSIIGGVFIYATIAAACLLRSCAISASVRFALRNEATS